MRAKPRYARADKGRIYHLKMLKASNALCGFRPSGPWFVFLNLRHQINHGRVCANCAREQGAMNQHRGALSLPAAKQKDDGE